MGRHDWMVLDVGEEIDGYRIDAPVARGGMAVIYKAIDRRLGRPVALKVIAPELAEDTAFRARFTRESELAASLEHPNILPIYQAGEVDGLLYIVMRFVDGEDIDAVLKRRKRLTPPEALTIFGAVADALDAAHAHDLVHRDVKPGNILLTGTDANGEMNLGARHVYLTDFGLTKRSASRTGLTTAGQFLGTIAYVAPEQIANQMVDHRADIYALGCVLHHVLTGEPPFARDDYVAMMWAHISESPPAASALVPELPPEGDAVLAAAMAKDPEARPQSCRELISRLRTAYSGPTVRSQNGDSPWQLPVPGAEDATVRVRRAEVVPRPSSPGTAGPRSSGQGARPEVPAPRLPAAPISGAPIPAALTPPPAHTLIHHRRQPTPSGPATNRNSAPLSPLPDETDGDDQPTMALRAAPRADGPRDPGSDDLGGPDSRDSGFPPRWAMLIAGLGTLAVLLVAGTIGFRVLNDGGGQTTGAPSKAPSAASGHSTAPTGSPAAVPVSVGRPKLVKTIPVGVAPQGVAFSPDGTRAYVANSDSRSISVIDTASRRVVSTIKLTHQPQYLAMRPDGVRLYASTHDDNGAGNGIAVIDPKAGKPVTWIMVGGLLKSDPYALAVSPDGSRLYVPDHTQDIIAVYDTSTNGAVITLPVVKAPHWVAFDPTRKIALVANHESNVLTIINTTNTEVAGTIPVGKSPHSVAVTPDGSLAFTANYDGDTASIVDLQHRKNLGNLRIGNHPRCVALAADGRHAYYAINGEGVLRVLDTRTRKITASVPVGSGPWVVSVAPDGRTAYVTNRDANTVSVLTLTS